MLYPSVDLQLRERDEPLQPDELFALPPFDALRIDPGSGKETRFAQHVRRRPGVVALRFYETGDIICHQGDPGWTAFYIPRDEDLLALRAVQLGYAEDAALPEAIGDLFDEDVEGIIRGEALETTRVRREKEWLAHDLRAWADRPERDKAREKTWQEAASALDGVGPTRLTAEQREWLDPGRPPESFGRAARIELAQAAEAERDRLERLARLLRASADRPPRKPEPEQRRHEAEEARKRIARRDAALLKLSSVELERVAEGLDAECAALDGRVRALLAVASRERWIRESEILRARTERDEKVEAFEAICEMEPAMREAGGDEQMTLLDRLERDRPDLEEEIPLAREALGRRRRAEVVVERPEEGELVVAGMYEGEFFGEIASLGRAVRCASVRAVRDGWVLELTRTVLEELTKAGEFGRELSGIFRRRIIASRLREVPAFTALDAERYKRLCDRAELVDHPYGATVFRQGEMPDAIYVVNSGYVRLSRSRDGVDRMIALLGPGEVVGITGVLAGKRRTATCTAHGHPAHLTRALRSSWGGQVQLIRIDAKLCLEMGAIT